MRRSALSEALVALVVAVVAAGIAALSFMLHLVDPTVLVGTLTAAGAVVLGALALHRFEWFLAAVIALRPSLDKVAQDDLGIIQPVSVLGLLLIAGCLAWLAGVRANDGLAPFSAVSKAFIFYAAAITVTAPASIMPVVSLTGAVKLASAAVLFVTLEQLYRRRPRSIWTLLGAGAIGVIVPVAVAYTQALWTGTLDPVSGLPRVDGTFVHPNPFATYLVVCFLVALAVAVRSTKASRTTAMWMLLLIGPAVLLTYARAGWGSLLAGVVFIGWRWDRRIFAAIVMAGVLVVAANPAVVTRLADLTAADDPTLGYENPNSMEWRVGYWVEIMPLGVASPLTGIGLDMVERVADDALPPHNTYVQAFVEAGIIGLGGLLAMLVATWRLIRSSLRDAVAGESELFAVAFAAAAFSVFLQLLTENLLTGVIPIWYLSIGLAWLAARPTSSPPLAHPRSSRAEPQHVGV